MLYCFYCACRVFLTLFSLISLSLVFLEKKEKERNAGFPLLPPFFFPQMPRSTSCQVLAPFLQRMQLSLCSWTTCRSSFCCAISLGVNSPILDEKATKVWSSPFVKTQLLKSSPVPLLANSPTCILPKIRANEMRDQLFLISDCDCVIGFSCLAQAC